MNEFRIHWMMAMLQRELRIIDTSIVGNILHGVAFFASTAILLVGVLIGLLIRPANAQEPLPDGRVAKGGNHIATAWLIDPTTRYPHGALGDRIEAGGFALKLRSGKTRHFQLDQASVFEDLEPRLIDLDADGRDEVVLIRAFLAAGAAVSVFKVTEENIRLWVQSPSIGLPNRWLNLAGFGDFDGDGDLEIAHVQTPHIGGILILSDVADGQWHEIARRAGVSNHHYRSRELSLSVVLDIDGQGRDAIVLPDQAGTGLIVARLTNGKLEFTPLPFGTTIKRMARTTDGIEITPDKGPVRQLTKNDLKH
jgi:hypothetical protein